MFTLRIQKGGYGAEYFLPDEVEVTYDHTTMYDFPIADRKRAHAFIVKQQQKNANMWNGPCVRLDKYEVRVPNEAGNARERGKLKLALSGLGWFGYVGMNQELGDQLGNKTRKLDEELIETIGFPHWFNSQEFSTCRFSNIVGTAYDACLVRWLRRIPRSWCGRGSPRQVYE